MRQTMLHLCGLLRRNHESEDGQALVELAFTLPVFVVLLLGTIEFGRVTYAATEVTNAAKSAAQYAAMNGGAYDDSSGITAVANADGYDLNSVLSTPITATASYACSCTGADTCTNNTAPTPPTGCTTSHMIVTVTVQTTATFSPLVHIPGFPTTVSLQGNAVQKVIP